MINIWLMMKTVSRTLRQIKKLLGLVLIQQGIYGKVNFALNLVTTTRGNAGFLSIK